MEVSEIKVSYSNKNPDKVKIVNSNSAYEIFIKYWNMNIVEFQEEVKILLLNRANIVLGIHELSKGGTSGSLIDIKIILSIALKCNASGVIIAHNHPSGNLKPSVSDDSITRRLKEACSTLDLSLYDHLIISKDSYYSYSDEGVL